jgi:hypothetical protein
MRAAVEVPLMVAYSPGCVEQIKYPGAASSMARAVQVELSCATGEVVAAAIRSTPVLIRASQISFRRA